MLKGVIKCPLAPVQYIYQVDFFSFLFKSTNIQSSSQPGLVWQIFQECGVFSIDVGVGIVVHLHQLSQRRHAGIVIHQHRREAGRFALDAAGTSHGSQKLKIFDVALPPGCACADIAFDCLLDTEQIIFEK